MTDPRHLHALAELWSLTAAWPHLERAVRAAEAAERDDADRGTLRSPTYGSGGSGGGGFARSAIADAVVGPSRHSRYAQAKLIAQAGIDYIAAPLRARRPDVLRTLTEVRAQVVRLHPVTAWNVGRHAADADRTVRRVLDLGDDHQPIVGTPCPACSTRTLAARTSAPEDRPVICAAGCRCAGEDCPCGMTVRVADVPHIWTRAEIVSAVRLERRKARVKR